MYDFSKISPAPYEPFNSQIADEGMDAKNYVRGAGKGYSVPLQNPGKKIHAKSPTSPSSSIVHNSVHSIIPSSLPKSSSKRKVIVRNNVHAEQIIEGIGEVTHIPVLSKTNTSLYPAKKNTRNEEVLIPVGDKNFVGNFPCESPSLIVDDFIDDTTHNDLSKGSFVGIDLADLDRELIKAKAELCKKDFAAFIREFWDEAIVEKLIWNWHMDFLCSELQPVAFQVANRKKKDKDIVINIPPGTSKSSITSIFFPVYCWLVDPTITFITASHEQDLATRQSNASRQLMKSEKFRQFFPHISMKETQDNKTDYENRNGGYRVATSTKSSPTGRHALVIILDDPQNPDTAYSEIERNNVNNWVGGTLSTRKSNKEVSVMITVQQRLHNNDVTGYLLSKEKEYNHICLPAELNKWVKPALVRENYINGLLDSHRLTLETLHDLQVDMGTKTYQTQINQAPNDEEAAILKEKWFQRISKTEFEALYTANNGVVDFFLDTAYTKKTSRDPSAILACCKIANNLFITGVKSVRYEFPRLVQHIKEYTASQGYTSRSKIIIEPKANGISIVQQLKAETALNVIQGKDSKEDKKTRLNAISAIVEAGRVFLIDDHWNNVFLSEVTADDPLHDDMRDCFVAAMETRMTRPATYGQHRFSFL